MQSHHSLSESEYSDMAAEEEEPFVEIEIDAPAERVWDILANVSRWKDVISGIDDILFTTSDDDDTTLRPGLAWDETRVMFGRSEKQRLEVAEVDAKAYYVKIKSESCGASVEFVHRVVPSVGAEGGSTIKMYVTCMPLTWAAWAFQWMAVLTRGMMRKELLQDLVDIKNEAEKSK